jgi:hypothetical protein
LRKYKANKYAKQEGNTAFGLEVCFVVNHPTCGEMKKAGGIECGK